MKNLVLQIVSLFALVSANLTAADHSELLYRCDIKNIHSGNPTRYNSTLYVLRDSNGKILIDNQPQIPSPADRSLVIIDCAKHVPEMYGSSETQSCTESDNKIIIKRSRSDQSPAFKSSITLDKNDLTLKYVLKNRHLSSLSPFYYLTWFLEYSCARNAAH